MIRPYTGADGMSLYEMVFSPTGGTQRVADILVHALTDTKCVIDLSDRTDDYAQISCAHDGTVLIAVPVFGGRVPLVASQRIRQVQGNGAQAIVVCVYGNRAFEDALVELQDDAEAAGFQVVAGVAGIAEHSVAHKFGAGRPDAADEELLHQFGLSIRRLCHNEASLHEHAASESAQTLRDSVQKHTQITIPGNRPYHAYKTLPLSPQATQTCTQCGLCAKRCPVGAISMQDAHVFDEATCISCMRCVDICPIGARRPDEKGVASVGAFLTKVATERKECELFC